MRNTRLKAATSILLLFSMLGLTAPAIGDLPTPPPLKNLAGQPFTPADFANRLLLVNFWATWCKPCRIEMPDLEELQSKFDPKEFTVVGIAADEGDAVAAFLQAVNVTYPVYAGDPDQIFAWSAQLGNRALGLPYSAIIDQSGNIVWTKSGGRISVDELVPPLNQLIEESSYSGDRE